MRISCGHQFSMAVTDIGELFVWGDNKNAKLALDIGPESVWRPTKLDISKFPGTINEISCGAEFSACILQTDSANDSGSLYAWGVSNYGQAGEEAEVRFPKLIHLKENVTRLSCGGDFAACISEKGRLYTWGRGNYGNLGHGTTDSHSKPLAVESLADQVILQVSCGAKHMLAVTSNFKLYSSGHGGHGRLGHGDTTGTSTPKLVESLTGENILMTAAGDSHSAAVTTLGTLFTWGCGTYGRLGLGSESHIYLPSEVASLKGKRMYMAACGFRHSLALSVHGEVFAWGGGNYGVTGLMDLKDVRNVLVPFKLQHLEGKKVTQIACGTWHSLAINSAGEIWTWGYHGHGRLGLGSESRIDQAFPVAIPSTYIYGITGGVRVLDKISQVTGSKAISSRGQTGDPWKIVQVSSGGQFSCALTKSGTVWVWGEGRNGIKGNGTSDTDQPVPLICNGLSHIIITSLSCGGHHCLASSASQVFSWGSGRYGQLGTGMTSSCSTPKAITLLQGKNITSCACGEDFSAVLTELGEVYTFGNGESGKLGHGNDSKQVFPKLVQELVNIKQVSAGLSHVVCLDFEGTVWTCGAGYYGRLANGSNENLYRFQKIHSRAVRRYEKVAAGSYHTLIVDKDGMLFAAGKKNLVLGKEDWLDAKLVQFFEKIKVLEIAAGEEHSVVVTADGSVFAWGNAKYGKVGNGSESGEVGSPCRIELPNGVIQVSTRLNHNLALLSSGDIYVWGCGSGGRLGTGNNHNIKTPKLLQTRWTVMSDKSGDLKPEDKANALDLIMSQLETGVRLTSLQEVMLVLQNESKDCYIQTLIQNQDLLQEKFSDLLKTLKSCKSKENSCTSLINEYESRILQRTYELKLPQRDYLKVSIPSYLASKHAVLEKIIWILQQQPCYMSKLVSTMQTRGARDLPVTIKSIRTVFSHYSSQDKSRESLLYLSLCKEVISSEIGLVDRLDDLFSSGSCLTAQFLLTFFSRDYGSELFSKLLFKSMNEALALIEAVGTDGFAVDIKQIANKGYRKVTGSAQTVLQDKRSKVSFDDAVVYTMRTVNLFVEGFKAFNGILPNTVKVLIKHAYSRIVQRAWLKEVEINLREKMMIGILRLVVAQILIPVIVTPESEGLVTRNLSNEEREVFGLIADVIKKVVNNSSFIGDHYTSLNEFIKVSHTGLVNSIDSCIELEDSLSVDLVVSIFLSHLSRDESFIHFPVNDLITLLVMLIKYRKSVELSGRDELFDLLDSISEIGSVVSSTIENYKINLKMQNSFLITSSVSICSLCGVPMPSSIAVISEKKEKVVKTIKQDNSGFIESFETVFRKIPPFACETLEDLSSNLRKLTEVMISVTHKQGPNPNYKLMFDLRQADERANDLIARNYSLDFVLFELSKRMTERHSHRNYIQKLSEGVHIIEDAQSAYLQYLDGKIEDLETCVNNVKLFKTSLNPNQKEMKNMAIFKLQEKHLQMMKNKKLDDLPTDVRHQIVGDVKVKVLEKFGVIDKLAHGFKAGTVEHLWMHYSNDRNSGWKFEVIFAKGRVKDMIGSFVISNEEFIDVRRTANSESKLEVPGVGTIRLGPFIIFLNSRIREQVV